MRLEATQAQLVSSYFGPQTFQPTDQLPTKYSKIILIKTKTFAEFWFYEYQIFSDIKRKLNSVEKEANLGERNQKSLNLKNINMNAQRRTTACVAAVSHQL